MFGETARKNLIAIATAYGKATNMTLSQISKRAYGNASFLDQFKRGKVSISLSKLDCMLKWFADHWPADAERPMLRVPFMRV